MTDKPMKTPKEELECNSKYIYDTGIIFECKNGCKFEVLGNDVVNLLNNLTEEKRELKFERDRYKRLSEIRQESINNHILTIKEFIDNCSDKKVKKTLEQLFHSEVKEYDLSKKIRNLEKENEELKEDNDIKFWKHELMIQWNKTQIISHELSLAIENGYEISEDFKKYIDELKERREENMKKAERLKI